MNRPKLESVLRGLTHACYVSGAALTLILATFFIQGFAAQQSARSLSDQSAGMRNRLEEDRARIAQASKLHYGAVSDGLAAAGIFQSRFERVAHDHNVEISEFRSGTELAPFLTAYAKDTANEGWTQVEAKVAMKGRLIDLMACLSDMSHGQMPFEIDSIELSRVLGETGATLVAANVQMRVLTRPSGGSQ